MQRFTLALVAILIALLAPRATADPVVFSDVVSFTSDSTGPVGNPFVFTENADPAAEEFSQLLSAPPESENRAVDFLEPLETEIGKPLYVFPALFDWHLRMLPAEAGTFVNPGAADLWFVTHEKDRRVLCKPKDGKIARAA